jgi:hypothetical protein
MLVVGDRDILRFGSEKSTKQRKAEKLINSGQHIRILGESDFKRIIDCGDNRAPAAEAVPVEPRPNRTT